MMNISNDEQKKIIRRTADAISLLQEGEDAISVLSRIYCQNLPDKSPRQGALMAQELLDWIGRFQQGYDEALYAPEDYVQNMLYWEIEAWSLPQQCAFLASQLAGFTGETPTEEAASEQVRDALVRELTRQILGENPSGSLPVPESGDAYSERKKAKLQIGEDMLLAMTSMVIYTMAKNGELSGLPKETTLAQVVIGVCTEEMHRELDHMEKFTGRKEEMQRKALRAVFFTLLISTAAAGAAVLLVKAAGVLAAAAIGGYLLLWLGVVLSVWYSSASEMVTVEPETVARIPVELPMTEDHQPSNSRQVTQKHTPWPEDRKTEQQKNQYRQQNNKKKLLNEN